MLLNSFEACPRLIYIIVKHAVLWPKLLIEHNYKSCQNTKLIHQQDTEIGVQKVLSVRF